MKLNANIASMEAYIPGKSSHGAVKLSSNENPLGASPKALQAILDTLGQVHRYPDGASTALRRGIADLWETAPSNLIIANGSDEVFTLLTAAWLSPGENAVSTRQTFSQYRYSVALFGGEMREVDLDRGKYDLEAMAALVNDKTRLVFICNPNNPTGTYLGHEELSSFLDGLPEGVIAVLDEAYADFAEAKDFPDSKALLKEHENLVVVRTFSKLYGLAGLRVGYGVGSSRITSGAERASMPFNVNNLAQAAARAALDDEEHRRLTLNLVHSERAFLADEFTRRGFFFYPSEANFVCFNAGQEAAHLWTPIARRGITVRDLKSFGLPKMIRYTFGCREDNMRLLAILDELSPN